MTLMGLLDTLNIFRKRPPVRDHVELAQFIDENAAFLAQKGIYEYSRARAGHYAKVLFAEAGFAEALERSRWSAYPLGLAMVGELAEGVLRPLADADPDPQRETMRALVKRAFEIAEPFARAYFNLMPIHRKLRASEFPTLHNYLKVTLCNIHDELTKRLDAQATVDSLRARAS
jgi:hypothetical protein